MAESSEPPRPLMQPLYDAYDAVSHWVGEHPNQVYGLSVGLVGLTLGGFSLVKGVQTIKGISQKSTLRSVARVVTVALSAIYAHDLCRSSFNIVNLDKKLPLDSETLQLPIKGGKRMAPSYFSWVTWAQLFFADEERSKVYHRGNILLGRTVSFIIACRAYLDELRRYRREMGDIEDIRSSLTSSSTASDN